MAQSRVTQAGLYIESPNSGATLVTKFGVYVLTDGVEQVLVTQAGVYVEMEPPEIPRARPMMRMGVKISVGY